MIQDDLKLPGKHILTLQPYPNDGSKREVIYDDHFTPRAVNIRNRDVADIIVARDNSYWNSGLVESLLNVIALDLKAGRDRWAQAVQGARVEYTQQLAEINPKGPQAVQEMLSRIVQVSADRHLRIIGLLPIENDPVKDQPVVSLLITERVDESFAQNLVNLGNSATFDEYTHALNPRYHAQRPGVYRHHSFQAEPDIALSTFSVTYPSSRSENNGLVDFQAVSTRRSLRPIEAEFANFLAGGTMLNHGLYVRDGQPRAVLLWDNPDYTAQYHLFDKPLQDLIPSPVAA